LPPSKELGVSCNNFNQVFNPGAPGQYAGVIKKNTLIRAWSGFEFANTAFSLTANDNFSSNTKHFHTVKTGEKLYMTPAASGFSTIATAAELGTPYGSSTYGTTVYSYAAYYTKTFQLGATTTPKPTKLTVNASSNQFSLKYRVSGYSDFWDTSWNTYTTLSTGTNEFPLTAEFQDQYIQYLVRFNSSTWNTADYISTVTLDYKDKVKLWLKGTFIVDDPQFQNTDLNISGRDYLRKNLETEINLPEFSNINIATAISYILDRTNTPYDTSSWDALATTVSYNTGVGEPNKSGWQWLDHAMDALNAGDDEWRFQFDKEGNAELKKVPTSVEADFGVNYFNNFENITKSLNSIKQLQRVTVVNKDIVVDTETLLKSISGVLASSTAVSATYADALYVRYVDNNNTILTERSRNNDGLTFTMTAGNYSIDIYGCTPSNVISNEIWAEFGNSNNIKNADGATHKIVNPLMDQSAANEYTKYIMAENADPRNQIELTMVQNPLFELNDNGVIIDRDTFTYGDIYNLVGIQENYSPPSIKQTLKFMDRGFDLGPVTYDRNGPVAGLLDFPYDIGMVYDIDIPLDEGDTTNYNYTKQVRFN
jgi:hypothetical protein